MMNLQRYVSNDRLACPCHSFIFYGISMNTSAETLSEALFDAAQKLATSNLDVCRRAPLDMARAVQCGRANWWLLAESGSQIG